MTPARYSFLTAAAALLGWARRLIDNLNTRDAEIEKRLKAAEDRLTAAENRLTAGGL